MEARDNTDVDNFSLAIGLNDKRHALGKGRSRIVDAKIVDMVADLVVLHSHVIGKVLILVGIDPDGTRICIPQDRKNTTAARWVPIPVYIVANFTAQVRVALIE